MHATYARELHSGMLSGRIESVGSWSRTEKSRAVKQTPKNIDPIMSVEEVAEYLSLHPLTVRRLARDGEIPAFKVGRQWRVKRALLERWIEEQSSQTTQSSSG